MTAVEDALQSPAVHQPRQLIVSLYGLYARQNNGWLSVASVVRLMADLGVDVQAVRSSISRLKRRGLLDARRVDGAAGYALTEVGREILTDGDARIFGRRRATVGDGWLLVVFSVPESERDKRHQLRSHLTRLGFGTISPGLWVAPGHLETETMDALQRLAMPDYTEVLRGQHIAFGELRNKVQAWWDLPALDRLYATFVERYRPVQERLAGSEPVTEAEMFTEYVEMLTSWRQLPYADPGLPLELLPEGWKGVEAEELFGELRRLLAGPASAHATRILTAGRR